MNLGPQLAKQLQEVILDGKWIAFTNFKKEISDLSWKQATTKVGSLNTIAALTFHINYYINGVADFFETGNLEIKDKFSFDMPPITSKEEWETLQDNLFSNAERFCKHVEQMSDEKLSSIFVKEEYGNFYRSVIGMVEHSYYHFGQVVIIKKLIKEGFG